MNYDEHIQMKEHPERGPLMVWPTVGFDEWLSHQRCFLCRFCEDGEHQNCLDGTEDCEECECASKGHPDA